MNPVTPELGVGQAVVYAKDQPQYRPLPSEKARLPNGRIVVVTRWRFTDEERAAIARGEDFFLSIMTFGAPLQPLFPTVGRTDILSYLNGG